MHACIHTYILAYKHNTAFKPTGTRNSIHRRQQITGTIHKTPINNNRKTNTAWCILSHVPNQG